MKARKIISVICNTLGVIILSAVILVAGALLVLQLMGHMPMAVLSGSMEPAYHVGGLVFIDTNVKPEDLVVGDVVAFRISEETVVTHRIVAIDNSLGFTVKGDNNNVEDGAPVPFDIVIGRAWKEHIPGFGTLMMELGTTRGFAAGALLLALLIVLFLVPSLLSPSKKKKKASGKDDEPPQKGEGASEEAPEQEAPEKEVPGKGEKACMKELRAQKKDLLVQDKKIAALDKMRKVLLSEKKEIKARIKALERVQTPPQRPATRRAYEAAAEQERIIVPLAGEKVATDKRRPTYGKLAMVVSAVVFTVALSVGVTYALFTASPDPATNVIPLGQVGVTVIEPSQKYELTEDNGYKAEKEVSVQNTGSVPSYVRARVVGALDKFEPIVYNTGDWYYSDPDDGGDGYWYYNGILEPDQTTPPLFSFVQLIGGIDVDDFLIPDSDPAEYDFSSLDIAVYAEAVQHLAYTGDSPAPGTAAAAIIAFENVKPVPPTPSPEP